MNQKELIKNLSLLIGGILIGIMSYSIGSVKSLVQIPKNLSPKTYQSQTIEYKKNTTAATIFTTLGSDISDSEISQKLKATFDLDNKAPGTKIYYSEIWGIGFTFLPEIPGSEPKVIEVNNKIYVDNVSIEVFSKDPKLTLSESIKRKFLVGYDPNYCFVETSNFERRKNDVNENDANYEKAVISFPLGEPDKEGAFGNFEKCKTGYTTGNWVAYFLMNKDVPEKFIFIEVGQDVTGFDGSGYSWTNSLQVIKL